MVDGKLRRPGRPPFLSRFNRLWSARLKVCQALGPTSHNALKRSSFAKTQGSIISGARLGYFGYIGFSGDAGTGSGSLLYLLVAVVSQKIIKVEEGRSYQGKF